MNSIFYVGMDVHKENYTLCCYSFEEDKVVYQQKMAPDYKLVLKYLEQIEVDGEPQTYYVMFMPTGNLKIKVSTVKADTIGIRQVYDKERVINIIKNITDEPIDMPENWNQRYKENLEKIKSGHLSEVALVFRNLLHRERQRGLSSAEKKMLSTAKQIIVSEIILTQDVGKATAEDILTAYVS